MDSFKDFFNTQSGISQLKELQFNRRRRLLEEQRIKRQEEWSYLRDLKRIVPHLDIRRESIDDKFRWEFSKNLMMSEWMMEEPEDLEDFILIPCPKGVRGTLIYEEPPPPQYENDYYNLSYNQRRKRRQEMPGQSRLAKIYSKTGQKCFEVKTNIPQDTILDVVWSKKNKTLYILDCMKYEGRDMTNCDTAFRRYWIESKFFECRLGIADINKQVNNLKLNFLDGFDFKSPHRVHHAFQKMPFFEDMGAELDGYLFYHKDGSYTPGESPLVLWMFPFMIDEVLTMFRVHPDYNKYKPEGYTNYIEYIEKFNEEKVEKKEKRFRNKRKKNEEQKKDEGGASTSKADETKAANEENKEK